MWWDNHPNRVSRIILLEGVWPSSGEFLAEITGWFSGVLGLMSDVLNGYPEHSSQALVIPKFNDI